MRWTLSGTVAQAWPLPPPNLAEPPGLWEAVAAEDEAVLRELLDLASDPERPMIWPYDFYDEND